MILPTVYFKLRFSLSYSHVEELFPLGELTWIMPLFKGGFLSSLLLLKNNLNQHINHSLLKKDLTKLLYLSLTDATEPQNFKIN